jgi:hypothetical protein
VTRRRTADLIVLAAYAATSFAFVGWRLVAHPGRVVVTALGGGDYQIFVWSFAWWPHAIGAGTNPFVTHALYPPDGINLTWTASSPGLALAFSPLTVLFGPTVAYNVAALILPALAAWTAYLLCRHLTGSLWASAVGGYLFGFATPMLGQMLAGHIHITGVFLVPLIALAVVRYVEGGLTRRGVAWRLGLLFGLQLWISTEVAFTASVMLALGLLLAACLLPDTRPRLRSALAPIATGYALGAVAAAPFVVYALRDFHGGRIINVDRGGGADLANLFVPTVTTGVGGSTLTAVSQHFASTTGSVYLGLPTLVIVVLMALRARRSRGARFLLAALGIATLATLGSRLVVAGHDLIPLPWWLAAHTPVIRNVVPLHLAPYVALAAAVIVAVWTATTRGLVYKRPYVLPALAVVAVVPALWRTSYPTFRPAHPERYAFFTDAAYKSCVPRNATVAIFPLGNEVPDLLWQAETGFWFRLAANGLVPVPSTGKALTSFDGEPFVREADARSARPTIDRILGFAAVHDVGRVIAIPAYGYPTAAQMRRLGPTKLTGGVLVAPACRAPALAPRRLASYAKSYREEAHRSRSNISWCDGGRYFTLQDGLVPFGPVAKATKAIFVLGSGVRCLAPPAGYTDHGYAPASLGVPANTYRLYEP